MNLVVLMGRLTRDPETRFGASNVAVDRRFKREGQPTADFFDVVAFGKTGEFVEKYLHKASKIVLSGEIQNNNYTDRNGNKVYGMQIVASNIEFAESKAVAQANGTYQAPQSQSQQPIQQPVSSPVSSPSQDQLPTEDDFMLFPDDDGSDGIPFDI